MTDILADPELVAVVEALSLITEFSDTAQLLLARATARYAELEAR